MESTKRTGQPAIRNCKTINCSVTHRCQRLIPKRKRGLRCGVSIQRHDCRFGDERVYGIAKSASLARRSHERKARPDLNG